MSGPFAPTPTPAPAGAEGGDDGRRERQVAQRVFAAEFNESKLKIKEAGQYSPAFVVTPFGAKVNRIFLVGALTRVEQSEQVAGSYRAQVVDPTGTFSVWAGQFEPEAAAQLANLQAPCIVAVVGKGALREADGGTTYVNVRPEQIRILEKGDRDAWVLETGKHSLARLDAMREALQMEAPSQKALEDLGYGADVAEGVVKALEHYGKQDLAKQVTVVRHAVESLLPGRQTMELLNAAPVFSAPPTPAATHMAPQAQKAAAPAAKPAPAGANPHEELILALAASKDDGKGAPWEDIVTEAAKKNVTEAQVEECLNSLMDKGLVYEPVLGRIKRT